ncbi:Bug family tripartite tricarboxylate transporter substrate binding protein [Hydrogenophaga sp. OTU3427]|uniref:Bug family tripartite tricarboxylate transporter substrate binding protein n=1 Tax=Hydrogenophaga sp. OTU3427 TaxID=3043856 RepID=UPI00313D4A42
MISKWKKVAAASLTGLLLGVSAAWAQTYPVKPVRLIVPFPPGGGGDSVGRLLGIKMSERLGKPVVIENLAGASGTIGIGALARSAPDGYSMGLITATMPVSDAVGGNKFDLVKDLDGVVMLAAAPMLITINSAAPDTNLKDFIARAKAHPGKLNFGSTGMGGISHLTGELFKLRTGIDMVHVPYAGGGPLLLALLSGQVDVAFSDAPPVLPHLKAGKTRVLAVSSATRSPSLSAVPSALEAGDIKDFETSAWYGIVVPAGTPKDIITRLNADFNAVLALPDIKEAFKVMALDILGGKPEAVTELTKREVAEWKVVVKKVALTKE